MNGVAFCATFDLLISKSHNYLFFSWYSLLYCQSQSLSLTYCQTDWRPLTRQALISSNPFSDALVRFCSFTLLQSCLWPRCVLLRYRRNLHHDANDHKTWTDAHAHSELTSVHLSCIHNKPYRNTLAIQLLNYSPCSPWFTTRQLHFLSIFLFCLLQHICHKSH